MRQTIPIAPFSIPKDTDLARKHFFQTIQNSIGTYRGDSNLWLLSLGKGGIAGAPSGDARQAGVKGESKGNTDSFYSPMRMFKLFRANNNV